MAVGDIVFFIPVDSILPPDIESLIFPPESKVKLSDSRVRQIRLRKYASLGILVESDKIINKLLSTNKIKASTVLTSLLEKDLSIELGITKYEPPAPKEVREVIITSKKRLAEHPQFHKYNGLENIKWGFPFEENEIVTVENKLHGSNARASFLYKEPKTLFEKIKKFFGLLPEYEYRYGSNNVDITLKNGNSGYYKTDIYGDAFEACNMKNKILKDHIFYGEVIGEGIQANYHYGHTKPHFVLFDVKKFENKDDKVGKWLLPCEVEDLACKLGLPYTEVLYQGPFKSKEFIEQFVSGKDPYYPNHEVREGIVIKSTFNYNDVMESGNKRSRKWVSPEYLDNKTNSDFH